MVRFWGFPSSSAVKNSPVNAEGHEFDPWVGKSPGGK